MAQAPQKAAAKAPPRSKARKTPLAEWIAAGLGLIIVIATLALIASEVFTADKSPPALSVRVLAVTRTEAGYLVTIEVENRGGSPAAGVVVEGEAMGTSGEAQMTETTFDFVPDHSSRKGGLLFAADPRRGSLSLRAKGYTDP